MVTVRRWYVFLVCAVSLNAIAWALIALSRNLLGQILINRPSSPEFVALQIAILLVGTPLYLAHWLWTQRLAARSTEERTSVLRRFYLIGVLAGFLAPILTNTANLLRWLLTRLPRAEYFLSSEYDSLGEAVLFNLIAILVLGSWWYYHDRVLRADLPGDEESAAATEIRRIYSYAFSAAGVFLTSLGTIHLIRWVLVMLTQKNPPLTFVPHDIVMVLLGLPVWLFFWTRGPSFWSGDRRFEHTSVLRKIYLYVVVFVSVLTGVGQATLVLAGLFRRALGLPSAGSILGPLPVLVVVIALWAYHAAVLKNESDLVSEAPRQAVIRRLYYYLIAAIGLAAFLIGFGGVISVMLRSFSELFGTTLKEQLAWFSAALISGLPVWLLAWRPAQAAALLPSESGSEERSSLIRKVYLYFYLFIATMTVLWGLIYTVYRILSVLLRVTSGRTLLVDIGQALAFTFVAVAVWLYHGSALRHDGSFRKQEWNQRLAEWRVVVIDSGEGVYGQKVIQALRREMPALSLDPVGLTPTAAAAMQAEAADIPQRLAQADLIVGSSSIIVPCGDDGLVIPPFAELISQAPALKLLAPTHGTDWEWIGVDRWGVDGLARQTVHAVKQIIEGESLKPVRPLGPGAVLGIIGIAMWVLPIVLSLVVSLLDAIGVF